MENNNQLPKVIKLFNFAKKERSLGGVYKISSIPRISEIARNKEDNVKVCLLYTSPSPRDRTRSRMPSSA